MTSDIKQTCNFCHNVTEAGILIQGDGVTICEKCVNECFRLIQTEKARANGGNGRLERIPTPQEIKSHLDKYVVGQNEAKKALAIAAYNHYKRTSGSAVSPSGVVFRKSNVMLTGPTGTGKTHLVETLAKHLEVPYISADATLLTEAGYAGADIENILYRLYIAADKDISWTERGIVYIDEIDKLVTPRGSPATMTASREGVQQGLLKILEGSRVSVPIPGKNAATGTIEIDTKDILFICGGAFVANEEVKRERPRRSIGFRSPTKHEQSLKGSATPNNIQRLISYGLIPEFVGRFPVIVELNELTRNQLHEILATSEHSIIREYHELLKLDDVYVEFSDDAIGEMINIAMMQRTGARGLRAIVENAIRDIMFEAPSSHKGKRFKISRLDILNSFRGKESHSTTLMKEHGVTA